jgi:hypothetical protein
MGAHFHLPIIAAGWDELARRLAGLELWLAEARTGLIYHRVDWRCPSALVIGSEAAGPSAAARGLAPRQVSIPMPGRAESLNAAVAAGVIIFEAARQRTGEARQPETKDVQPTPVAKDSLPTDNGPSRAADSRPVPLGRMLDTQHGPHPWQV